MADTMHSFETGGEVPMVSAILFFLFSRGFGQSPKNAKTIEKQKKQNGRHHAQI